MDNFVKITSNSGTRPNRNGPGGHGHRDSQRSSRQVVEVNHLSDLDIGDESDDEFTLDKIKTEPSGQLNVIQDTNQDSAVNRPIHMPKKKQRMMPGIDYGTDLLINKKKHKWILMKHQKRH